MRALETSEIASWSSVKLRYKSSLSTKCFHNFSLIHLPSMTLVTFSEYRIRFDVRCRCRSTILFLEIAQRRMLKGIKSCLSLFIHVWFFIVLWRVSCNVHGLTHDGHIRPMASARESLSVTFFYVEFFFYDDFQPKALGSAVWRTLEREVPKSILGSLIFFLSSLKLCWDKRLILFSRRVG